MTPKYPQQWFTTQNKLLKAFISKPECRTAARLGYAEYQTKKYRDAAEHLSFFLLPEPPSTSEIDPSEIAKLTKALEDAKKKIGTLHIRVQFNGTDVSNAKLLIEGVEVALPPLSQPVYVEPGHSVVQVKADGYEISKREIDISDGTDKPLLFELTPSKLPGQGPTPGTGPDPGQKPPPVIVAPTPPAWRTPAIALGTGLAVVGVGLGVGLSLAAAGKNSDAIQEQDALIKRVVMSEVICPAGYAEPRCKKLAELVRARDAYQSVAIAGFVVGGVAAVGAVVAALYRPSKPASGRPTSTSLMILPYPRGAILMGSF